MNLQKQIDELLEQTCLDLWSITSQGTGQSVKPQEYESKKQEILTKTRVKIGEWVCDFLKNADINKLRSVLGLSTAVNHGADKEEKVDVDWPPEYDSNPK